mgnify:FL=1
MNTTWRILLEEAIAEAEGLTLSEAESCTLTDEELDVEFYAGFGSPNGERFTLWTKNKVYFPVCYDGAEYVGCASRNPDGKPTEHIGGW